MIHYWLCRNIPGYCYVAGIWERRREERWKRLGDILYAAIDPSAPIQVNELAIKLNWTVPKIIDVVWNDKEERFIVVVGQNNSTYVLRSYS